MTTRLEFLQKARDFYSNPDTKLAFDPNKGGCSYFIAPTCKCIVGVNLPNENAAKLEQQFYGCVASSIINNRELDPEAFELLQPAIPTDLNLDDDAPYWMARMQQFHDDTALETSLSPEEQKARLLAYIDAEITALKSQRS